MYYTFDPVDFSACTAPVARTFACESYSRARYSTSSSARLTIWGARSRIKKAFPQMPSSSWLCMYSRPLHICSAILTSMRSIIGASSTLCSSGGALTARLCMYSPKVYYVIYVCTCPILDFVPDQQQKAMAGASKELGCELPGSLGLGQSYVRPPKTLEAQENRTCSDCCTTTHSGAWGAFFCRLQASVMSKQHPVACIPKSRKTSCSLALLICPSILLVHIGISV